ncbi:uncharacterized protein LOC144134291 [Amblyomma americanum]
MCISASPFDNARYELCFSGRPCLKRDAVVYSGGDNGAGPFLRGVRSQAIVKTTYEALRVYSCLFTSGEAYYGQLGMLFAMKGTLTPLFWLALSSAATDCSPEWCTPPYGERLEEVIERSVQGVPEVHTSKMGDEEPGLLSFVHPDGYRVTGLNRLRRHGQLRACCYNETQAVSFDLASEEPVVCSFFWIGSGNGTLELAAHDVKMTTHLRFIADPTNDSAVESRRILDEYEEPVGTALRTGSMTVNISGISDGAATGAEARFMRFLALAAIQDSWEELFVPKFVEAVKRLVR